MKSFEQRFPPHPYGKPLRVYKLFAKSRQVTPVATTRLTRRQVLQRGEPAQRTGSARALTLLYAGKPFHQSPAEGNPPAVLVHHRSGSKIHALVLPIICRLCYVSQKVINVEFI
ncbi:hypothetical protein QUB80_09095 [Chlorogloeopsis sp. ULAP01]|uniref:hypothetical protein n=1 Tax=Chlorogloeopsis sp. ULAP01 TaxID=3056483 RepID=UPI0025AAC4BE|nr:hypothetical protein [Chlorogloeopsis sp. ULAP01]MDM9380858.1 hypothetical protein [Chlorogloeopsis sp. ULAP01]